MGTNPKVFAALTTTGMVLSLSLPTSAIKPAAAAMEENTGVVTEPLSLRVDRLKAKMRNAAPPHWHGTIKNIVQFFNFSNCSKGKWNNC